MQVKAEAWSLSKIIIGSLLTMLIAMGIWNFQQQDSRLGRLEAHYVILDKEKIGKQELKEVIDSINQRMDAMVNSLNNMQQLQTQNILLRIESQQQTLARLEAHLLNAVPSKK